MLGFWKTGAVLLLLVTTAARVDLSEFNGYYQLQDGRDMYIQILTRGDKLVLRQMWDNIDIPFERKSDLEFYNTQRQFPLVFTRAGGKITQVIAFSKDVWKKVNSYNVVKRKEVRLNADELRAFEGIYQLGWSANERLKIIVKGNHLIVTEMWSGKKMEIAPESPLQFFGKEIRSVEFSKDEKGNVKEALIFGKDV